MLTCCCRQTRRSSEYFLHLKELAEFNMYMEETSEFCEDHITFACLVELEAGKVVTEIQYVS